MKKLIIYSFAILMFASVVVEAKTPAVDEDRLNRFLTNIENSLKSENEGVRFWSLFLLARLKSDAPEMDLSQFNRALNRMTDRDEEELLRVNAKMTYLYLNEPELVKSVRVLDRENPLVFYAQLYVVKYQDKFKLDVNPNDRIKELVTEIETLESQM